MGEAKRRREAAMRDGPWPGSAGRCPQCLGTNVGTVDLPADLAGEFYASTLTVCAKCGIAWEPIDESLIWDRTDPECSFSKQCDNCAFRSGSHEQRDAGKWRETIGSLRKGGQFFCHKGVPLALGSEDGFAYPKGDLHKMRHCRGYLNALGKWWKQDGVSTR